MNAERRYLRSVKKQSVVFSSVCDFSGRIEPRTAPSHYFTLFHIISHYFTLFHICAYSVSQFFTIFHNFSHFFTIGLHNSSHLSPTHYSPLTHNALTTHHQLPAHPPTTASLTTHPHTHTHTPSPVTFCSILYRCTVMGGPRLYGT